MWRQVGFQGFGTGRLLDRCRRPAMIMESVCRAYQAVIAIFMNRMHIRLWAKACHSSTAQVLSRPRTLNCVRPRRRRCALAHSTVAPRCPYTASCRCRPSGELTVPDPARTGIDVRGCGGRRPLRTGVRIDAAVRRNYGRPERDPLPANGKASSSTCRYSSLRIAIALAPPPLVQETCNASMLPCRPISF